MNRRKFEFSAMGFFVGCFFFFLSFVLLHAYWIGNTFESILSILITIYLGACTWAFSYVLNELDRIIDLVMQRPLGFTISKGLYVIFYFTAPLIYLGLYFLKNNYIGK